MSVGTGLAVVGVWGCVAVLGATKALQGELMAFVVIMALAATSVVVMAAP